MMQQKRDKGEKKRRMIRRNLDKKTSKYKWKGMWQELVFTYSPGALSEEDAIEYLKQAHQFVINRFPECDVISSIIHLDETTLHLHIHIDYFDMNDARFIQDELANTGRTNINNIRNDFQEEVADGYGLIKQDGSVVGDLHDGAKADKDKGELKRLVRDYSIENDRLRLENQELKNKPVKVVEIEKEVIKEVVVENPINEELRERYREDSIKINALWLENQELKNKLAKVVEVEKEVIKEVMVENPINEELRQENETLKEEN